MKTDEKYLDDYNYHNWSKFMVREPKDRPKGPHFAAVLFESMSYTTSGYDRDDPDEHHSFKHVDYFAFPDKETLQAWVLRAAKANMQFFFFEVKKLGQAQLNVSVDLGM